MSFTSILDQLFHHSLNQPFTHQQGGKLGILKKIFPFTPALKFAAQHSLQYREILKNKQEIH
jgi:hypothetical protein